MEDITILELAIWVAFVAVIPLILLIATRKR